MSSDVMIEHTLKLRETAQQIMTESGQIEALARKMAVQPGGESLSPFIIGLTVFVLACFIGYYVVWRVTPALHSPLMSVTNAISSVIIVGALIAVGPVMTSISTFFGFLAVFMAAVNIFGGFIVTQRMLQMFAKSR